MRVEIKAFCGKCKWGAIGTYEIQPFEKFSILCNSCKEPIVEICIPEQAPIVHEMKFPEDPIPQLMATLERVMPDFDEEMKKWITETWPRGYGLYE